MTVVLGSGEHRYRVVENWAKLPDGWNLTDVAAVAVDSKDRVYVFNRGEHPMVVLNRDGSFIKSWGEGLFTPRARPAHRRGRQSLLHRRRRPHGAQVHHRRQGAAHHRHSRTSPRRIMSGEPFHRCTHTALSPKGEIYVSDGYGNACVHKYTPDGKLMKTWGEPGTDPGQFNIVHNIVADADGWVYVADRENHRVQVFDGNGKYETQWNNLHRPCALCCCGGKKPNFIVGELGPGMSVNLKSQESRSAPHHRGLRKAGRSRGSAARTARDSRSASSSRRTASRSNSKGDIYRRRGRRHQLEDQLSRHADAEGGALSAEAGEGRVAPTELEISCGFPRQAISRLACECRVLRKLAPSRARVADLSLSVYRMRRVMPATPARRGRPRRRSQSTPAADSRRSALPSRASRRRRTRRDARAA